MTRSEFYAAWLRHFACDISKADIDKYVVSTGNYLWHIFSWELIDQACYLSGDAAREAYDCMDKHDVWILNWFDGSDPCNLLGGAPASEQLDEMNEVYVTASDFSWTYMKTHEAACGPYFMKL